MRNLGAILLLSALAVPALADPVDRLGQDQLVQHENYDALVGSRSGMTPMRLNNHYRFRPSAEDGQRMVRPYVLPPRGLWSFQERSWRDNPARGNPALERELLQIPRNPSGN